MNTQIYEEAADWIIRNRDGELDASQKHAFDAWLRRSPDHVRAYFEMTSIWEDLSALDSKRNRNAEDLIARAREGDNVIPFDAGSPSQVAGPTPVSAGRSSRRHLLAASVAIACVGAAVLAWMNRGPDYSTGVGEQRSITLTDGSTIDLNAQTRIRIRLSDQERDIDLIAGQALFHVAKDKTRPFVVNSAGTAVRAVGTEFDVYQRKGGTTVTVLEGRVSVMDAGAAEAPPSERRGSASTFLSAGQQLTVTRQAIAQPVTANLGAATAWTQHRLVLDGASLPEVAEEFNRYNSRRLIIDDARLANFRVSGSFSSLDPTLLLRFLRSQPGISVTETDREIRVSKE